MELIKEITELTPEEEKLVVLMKVKVDALCEEVNKIPLSKDIKVEEDNLFPFCYKMRLYFRENYKIFKYAWIRYALEEVSDRFGPITMDNNNFQKYILEQDKLKDTQQDPI